MQLDIHLLNVELAHLHRPVKALHPRPVTCQTAPRAFQHCFMFIVYVL